MSSPTTTLGVAQPLFFEEDVEAVELYFLKPTGNSDSPYEYLDYSANTVKFAVGTTTPAALQITWSALTTAVTTTITSLVTGGGGSNEQQRITLSPQPASGGFAIQLPSRNVTVSSVSANIFTAADHGLYSGQSVSLTAFSLTASAVANGSSYFVIRTSKDTFSLASTATSTTSLTAAVTSGGGTATLPATTTGQLAHNASPAAVQSALLAAGLSENNAPQILVTGAAGKEYVFTYANGSANRDYANVSIVGSTLQAAAGLQANVNFSTTEVAALIAAGTTSAKLEIEVSGGGRRQTYQTTCTLASDLVNSVSPTPVPASTSFTLQAPNTSTWTVTIDNNGVLTATRVPLATIDLAEYFPPTGNTSAGLLGNPQTFGPWSVETQITGTIVTENYDNVSLDINNSDQSAFGPNINFVQPADTPLVIDIYGTPGFEKWASGILTVNPS